MDYTTTHIEEIHRKVLATPQIRLKIINLNLNDRGHSMTPPPPMKINEDKTLVPYIRKPLVLKRTHKLQSFEHMLLAIDDKKPVDSASFPRKDIPNGSLPSRDNQSKHATSDKESQTDDFLNDNETSHGQDSTLIIFVKGMNMFSADREKIISTIVNLLDKHVVSVSSKEHKLFAKDKKMSSKSSANHVILKGALLAINELIDEGALTITPHGLVQIAQGVTFTLCFHKTLIQFAKDIWKSKHAELIRDAWMSFGGLAAVLVMSATRQ